MAELKIEVIAYKCERCKHQWLPRGKEKPLICPRCKSPYWNRSRRKYGAGNRYAK